MGREPTITHAWMLVRLPLYSPKTCQVFYVGRWSWGDNTPRALSKNKTRDLCRADRANRNHSGQLCHEIAIVLLDQFSIMKFNSLNGGLWQPVVDVYIPFSPPLLLIILEGLMNLASFREQTETLCCRFYSHTQIRLGGM